MSLETWFSFALASTLLVITPGPSILLTILHGIQFGPKKTVITALGDITANFLQILFVAYVLNLSMEILSQHIKIIKYLGSVLLIYFGIKLIFEKTQVFFDKTQTTQASRSKLYCQGFLVAACNPKTLLFLLALFPQFIDTAQSLYEQIPIMCSTTLVIDFIGMMSYALGASRFLSFAHQYPGYLNRITGMIFLGFSCYLMTC